MCHHTERCDPWRLSWRYTVRFSVVSIIILPKLYLTSLYEKIINKRLNRQIKSKLTIISMMLKSIWMIYHKSRHINQDKWSVNHNKVYMGKSILINRIIWVMCHLTEGCEPCFLSWRYAVRFSVMPRTSLPKLYPLTFDKLLWKNNQ